MLRPRQALESYHRRAPRLAALLTLAVCLATGLSSCDRPQAPSEPVDGPRLILLLVVDQLGSDTLERVSPLLTGGLARLLAESAVFVEGHHAHAASETAPGHASLATGRHPRGHGIIRNYWFDRATGELTYAVDDPRDEVAPRRLLATTLGDWAKAQQPSAKVYATSAKDRAAILMGGHDADGAFWYDHDTGEMVTSSYYGATEPSWLVDFNSGRRLDRFFGEPWEPLPLSDQELATVETESWDFGPLLERFPHVAGGTQPTPGDSFYGALYSSPRVDDLLADFAHHVVVSEQLGRRDAVDVLALSFSALDSVGHTYGPHSREALDVLLRLDRRLGDLLTFIEGEVGEEHLVVGFSADHGVAPLPELQASRGLPGARIGAETLLCLQRLERRLAERLGGEGWLSPGPVLRRSALERTGVERPAAEAAATELIGQCPGVARAWTRTELLDGAARDQPFGEGFYNTYHPDRSPDLLIQFEELLTPVRRYAATHGSAYPYDVRVPLLVRAPGVRPERHTGPAATVDLAPTLAALAGLSTPEGVDGRHLLPNE